MTIERHKLQSPREYTLMHTENQSYTSLEKIAKCIVCTQIFGVITTVRENIYII